MKYGNLPIDLGIYEIESKEMMFYQYLPIKLKGKRYCKIEKRLEVFDEIIEAAFNHFKITQGIEKLRESYVYITAKHQYQTKNNSFNRTGYHSDGFLTDDVNYIWCDKSPTIFNKSNFDLTLDDLVSMSEMESQALKSNEFTFGVNKLLCLDQYNIHKVADDQEEGFRTFLKISFSKDKYDLIGNSHNYELDYNWKMKERKSERNIPQSIIK